MPESIFSDELQTLLNYDTHPMARQFRSLVVKALQMQEEDNGIPKHISFSPELMLELAVEIDTLLDIIKGLAEIVAKQSTFESTPTVTGKEYLS